MGLPFPEIGTPLLADASAQGAEAVVDTEVFGRVVERKVKRGINLTGGSDYDAFWSFPTTAEIAWAKRQGFEVIRVPYRWERLQPTLGGAFNAGHQAALDAVVREIVAQGMIAMPVAHNFGGRVVVGGTGAIGAPEVKIGTASVTHAHWEDFVFKLASLWGDISDSVWLDLMNEPESLPLNGYATETDHLVAIYNKAIVQARTAGFTGRIVLEGNGYNNAQFFDMTSPWYNTGSVAPSSADAFHAGIVDSGNNWIASVHNYPEPDHGNSTDPIANARTLRTRMQNVIDWCTSTGRTVIVGEFAANASDQYGEPVVRDFLELGIENADKIEAMIWWEARNNAETGDAYNIPTDVVPVDERINWIRDLDAQVEVPAAAPAVEGSLSLTTADATASSAGTARVAGALSQTAASATSAATGAVRVAGALAQTAAAATAASAGTVRVAGALARTTDSATVASAGTARVAGTLSQSTAGAAVSSAGAVRVAGALASTLEAATASAAGAIGDPPALLSLAATLANATASAAGSVLARGQAAVATADATLSSVGGVRVTGTASVSTASATALSSGVVRVSGQLAVSTDAASVSAQGAVRAAGALARTLDSAVLVAEGSATSPLLGELAAVLADATLNSTGGVLVQGALAVTLQDAVLVSLAGAPNPDSYVDTSEVVAVYRDEDEVATLHAATSDVVTVCLDEGVVMTQHSAEAEVVAVYRDVA